MITDNFKQKVTTVCSCLSRDVDFFNVVLSYEASFSMPFYEPSTGHYQTIFGEYHSTPLHLNTLANQSNITQLWIEVWALAS